MMLIGGAGGGIVNMLQEASDGEPIAYWMAAFFGLYALVAMAFLARSWLVRTPNSKDKLLGYTFVTVGSIGLSVWMFIAIVTRLP